MDSKGSVVGEGSVLVGTITNTWLVNQARTIAILTPYSPNPHSPPPPFHFFFYFPKATTLEQYIQKLLTSFSVLMEPPISCKASGDLVSCTLYDIRHTIKYTSAIDQPLAHSLARLSLTSHNRTKVVWRELDPDGCKALPVLTIIPNEPEASYYETNFEDV